MIDSVYIKDVDMIKILIERDVPLNGINEDGMIPICIAYKIDCVSIFNLLLNEHKKHDSYIKMLSKLDK